MACKGCERRRQRLVAQYERMRLYLEQQEAQHQQAGSWRDNSRAVVAWCVLSACEMGEQLVSWVRGRRG